MNEKIKLTDEITLTLKELVATGTQKTLIQLLRKKTLNPENVPEEMLMLKDESGTSVLDVCIERFKESVLFNIDKNGNNRLVPRAWLLANTFKTWTLSETNPLECLLPKHFRTVEEILAITDQVPLRKKSVFL